MILYTVILTSKCTVTAEYPVHYVFLHINSLQKEYCLGYKQQFLFFLLHLLGNESKWMINGILQDLQSEVA